MKSQQNRIELVTRPGVEALDADHSAYVEQDPRNPQTQLDQAVGVQALKTVSRKRNNVTLLHLFLNIFYCFLRAGMV